MYLNALESQSIPNTYTLSLIYLPNQARSTVQSPAIEVTEQNESPVKVTKSPSEANNSRQSPVVANAILNKSPITVTNTLSLIRWKSPTTLQCRRNQEARFHYKQGSITTHLALFYHMLFLYCYVQLCFKNVSSVYEYWLHCDYISTCILKWKGVFSFPNVSGIFTFKGEHSPQYDYISSHCVSKNSLSI